MRKPRGVQIRANRLIGPWEVLGGDDRRVPAKGRGRTAPYRGRSGASWIWSTPLDAGASEGELRSGYALTPSPSHSKNNLSFLQKGGPRKESSQRTATALFFYPSCGDFQLSLREFHLSLIRDPSPTPGIAVFAPNPYSIQKENKPGWRNRPKSNLDVKELRVVADLCELLLEPTLCAVPCTLSAQPNRRFPRECECRLLV